LTEGNNLLSIRAVDSNGNQVTTTRNVVRDSISPTLTVAQPNENAYLNTTTLAVLGTVQDQTTTTVTINGVAATISGNNYSANIPITEGVNTIISLATDAAGNSTSLTRNIIRDTVGPTINISQPVAGLVTNATQITVSGTYNDASPTTITVNGTPATIQGNNFTALVSISEGANVLQIAATDAAGNQGIVTNNVVRDSIQPVVSVQSPGSNETTYSSQFTVTGTYSDATTTIIAVNNLVATLNGDNFIATISLAVGSNTIQIQASDAAGNQNIVAITIVRKIDTIAPILSILTPGNNNVTNSQQVTIVGTVADETPTTILINGGVVTLDGNQFSSVLTLNEGNNNFLIEATDSNSNHSEVSISISKDSLAPSISLTEPAEGAIIKTVTVAGTVTDSGATSVLVNGSPVMLVDGSFRTEFRPEDRNDYQVTVTVSDTAGNTTETIRTVTVDNTPPEILNLTPVEGTIIDETANIQGQIQDSTPTTVGVNGINASVTSNNFNVNVPIAEGDQQLVISATDAAGNVSSTLLNLVGKDKTQPLPPTLFPLISPTRLSFQIIEGLAESGSKVIISNGDNNVETYAALGTGLFAANINLNEGQNSLLLFSRDEAGNNSQPLQITVSRDSSTPLPPAGFPSYINISTGNTQKGLVNAELPRPLVAIVTDRNGTPVQNVPVQFLLQSGNGIFTNGSTIFETTTNSLGYASVRYISGADAEPILVRANFPANSGTPAVYIAETLKPSADGITSVSGIVLDQNLRALPNVLVRIGGQQTRTGTKGRFILRSVATGPHQLLELIGRDQITLPGRWANISYDLDLLPEIKNEVGRPLFLPKVNEGVALPLDDNNIVLTDTTFELPVVGGELPVRVTAKSGTRIIFPPDVTNKKLSVTRIPTNRVPMTLEDGLATNLYISVQPSGAVFETPLEVSFPNLDRLPSNSEVLLMSFEHDAGRYVKVGSGRVTADGREVKSNPGSGIRVGAWHAVPPPEPQPEVTVLSHVKVKDNPLFEDAIIKNSETWVEGTRAVLLTNLGQTSSALAGPGQISTPTQLDYRATLSVPRGTAISTKVENTTDVVKTKVRIKDLTFSGETYYPVTQDTGTVYSGQHWYDKNCDTPAGCNGKASDNGDNRFPVVYVRSMPANGTTAAKESFITLRANFVLDKAVDNGLPVKVSGKSVEGIDFEATTTVQTAANKSTFTITDVKAKSALPQTVKFYNSLKIKWKYTFDDKVGFDNLKEFKDAGETDNRVYVILKPIAPQVTAGDKKIMLYESVANLGSRAADGQSDEAGVLSAIWREFLSKSVKRKKIDGFNKDDGKTLTYWGPPAVHKKAGEQCQTIQAMLTTTPTESSLNGVGTCKAWAQFLTYTLFLQGISGIEITELKPPAVSGDERGFLVRNWTFGKHIRTGNDGTLNSTVASIPTPNGGASYSDYSRFKEPYTGKGLPNSLCIGPKDDGVLQTTKKDDDEVLNNYITTGPDGICNTDADVRDEELIAKGKGLKNSVGISPFTDLTLESSAGSKNAIFDTGVVSDIDSLFPYLELFPAFDETLTDVQINAIKEAAFKETLWGDVGILPGELIKAQSNDNSPNSFGNHFIVKYQGQYYDPSYGAGPFPTVADHEKAASSGISKKIPKSGEPYSLLYVQKKNPSEQQLEYKLSECFGTEVMDAGIRVCNNY
jgi:Glucodextranase, domain B